MVIDELITVLGFKQTGTAHLEAYKRNINGVVGSIGILAKRATIAAAAITAASVAIGGGLIAFVKPVAEEYDKLIKVADRVGVSFEKLQELGFAAEQSGSTLDGLAAGLTEITKRLGEAERGTGRAKKALDDYGLSAVDSSGKAKKADEFLIELADVFTRLTEAQQVDLASKLGLDQGLMTMLKSGREGIVQLMEQKRRLGVVDEEQARAAERFNDQLNATVTGVKNLRDRVALSLLPVLTRWLESMENWIVANREVLRQGLERAAAGLARVLESVARMGAAAARTIGWVATEVERLTGISMSTLVGAAGFGLLIRRHPIIAFFIALLAVLDDIRVYMSGEGESVIGTLVGKFQEFAETFPGLANMITQVGGALFYLVAGLLAFRLAVTGIKASGAALAGIFSFMGAGAGVGAAAGAGAGTVGGAAAAGGAAGLSRWALWGGRAQAALGAGARFSGWLTAAMVAWRARAGLAASLEEALKGNIFGGLGSGGQGGFVDRFLYSIGEAASGMIEETFSGLFGSGRASGLIDANAPGGGPKTPPPTVEGQGGNMEWVPGVGYVVRPAATAKPGIRHPLLGDYSLEQVHGGVGMWSNVYGYGKGMAARLADAIAGALSSILQNVSGPLQMLGGAIGVTAQAPQPTVTNSTVNVSVSAPVNITMTGTAATPGAVGAAVSGAITGAASRAADILASEPAADASPALGAQGAAG